jgi:uncharacterized protein
VIAGITLACRTAIAFSLLALLACSTSTADEGLDSAFASTSIVIQTSGTACYDFTVYLALTPKQQQRGLMHVRRLPKFTGMLFVYRHDDIRSMWMKNTFMPLDLLFIRSDGSVSSIAPMTEPLSLRSIASAEAVRYVLELNGGVAEELEIDTGSVVYLTEL